MSPATKNSSYRIKGCNIYFTPHPGDCKAHAGTAIILKSNLKHTVLTSFFNFETNEIIFGGDWNDKHKFWGSRITLPRGWSLKSCLYALHLTRISTGEPTIWPSDAKLFSDLLDFFITMKISNLFSTVPIVTKSNTTRLLQIFFFQISSRVKYY